MKNWYSIKAKNQSEYDVHVYDEIGIFGITARAFIDDFKKIPSNARVNLRINSIGGDVYDGVGIHSVLNRHPAGVFVTIDGLAASIASLIAMVGKTIAIVENGAIFIHPPWGVSIGDSEDMHGFAESLEKIESSLIKTYADRSGQTPEKIRELMENETWMDAQEAKELGFVDEIIPAVKIAALTNLSRFKSLPPSIAALNKSEDDKIRKQLDLKLSDTTVAIMRECAATGWAELGPFFLDVAIGKPELNIRAEIKRADSIKEICNRYGVVHRAITFIKAGVNPEDVEVEILRDFPPGLDAKTLTIEQARARLADIVQIRAQCGAARMAAAVADVFVIQGRTPRQVSEALIRQKLTESGPDIINTLGMDELLGQRSHRSATVIDYKSIYDRRKRQPEPTLGAIKALIESAR